MWLKQIGISDCRCIVQADLTLSEHCNWLIGDNAAGKSSFLEALSILSRGRSFRTPRIQDVIRYQQTTLTVTGKLFNLDTGSEYPLGISKTARETKIRINHADIHQQAELSSHLPITVIHPGSLDIITGSPTQRRSLLDWIAFYRNTDFHNHWKNYQRILKQRNTCLRDSSQRYALQYWTEQLISLQPVIHQFRLDALNAMRKALKQLSLLCEPVGESEVKLLNGFPAQVDIMSVDKLERFFRSKQDQEIHQGTTLYGCHRGDVNLLMNGHSAARVASRGQLKMLSIALLLAQSQAITNEPEKRGIIAIDDLASELDENNQSLLHQVLEQTQQQLVITGTRQTFNDKKAFAGKMFHVEHGSISEMQS